MSYMKRNTMGTRRNPITSFSLGILLFLFSTVTAKVSIEITKRAPVHISDPSYISSPEKITIELLWNVQLKDSLDTADTLGVTCDPLEFLVDDEQAQTVFEFELDCDRQHTTLVAVRLSRSASGDEELYLPEVIKVTTPQTFQNPQPPQYFPIYRWLGRSSTVTVWEGDTFLPQDDPDREQRARFLDRERRRYRPVPFVPNIVYFVANVSSTEWFDRTYFNTWFLQYRNKAFGTAARTAQGMGEMKDFQDAYQFYEHGFTEPSEGFTAHVNDHDFALQRTQGANPNVIKLVRDSLPPYFQVSEARVSPFLEGNTIAGAIAAEKLFIVDYAYISRIMKQDEGVDYFPAPVALFYQRKNKELSPIAIHTDVTSGSVFYPDDAYYHWVNAKLWFNIADSSIHEAGSHLTDTHLFVEHVVIGASSTMSISHPVLKMMKPHFRYVVAQNRLAVGSLLVAGGAFDQFNIGKPRAEILIAYTASQFNILGNGHFLNDLMARGVYSKSVLYNYRTRDDGLLYWNAIHTYVSEVFEEYYGGTPEKMSEDAEIQSFNVFMRDVINMKGFPQGQLTIPVAIEIVTAFIFRSSVVHAMVNSGQYTEFGQPISYPCRLQGPVPSSTENANSQSDIMKTMVPASSCMTIAYTLILTQQDFGTVGSYEKQYIFPPSPVFAAADRFRRTVNGPIQEEIHRRNMEGRKYNFLLSHRIPNAPSL